jgi:hypothetical protein
MLGWVGESITSCVCCSLIFIFNTVIILLELAIRIYRATVSC